MGWLAFGLALLALGLHSKVWEIIGWKLNRDGDLEDGGNILRLVIRIVLTAFGIIIVSASLPGVSGLSHPGVFFLSLVCLYVGFSDKLYDQTVFRGLIDYYTGAEGRDKKADPLVFFTSMKIISMVLGVIFLAVGVGTGNPDWKVEPCPICDDCPVVEQVPAPVKQEVAPTS